MAVPPQQFLQYESGCSGLGQTIGEAQTSTSGTYSISWNDPLLFSFPSSGYQLRVTSENVGDWRVTDEDDILYGWTSSITITGTSQSAGTRTLGGDEAANVFVTVFNFWDHVVNQSTVLSNRMTSVRISVNVADTTVLGCATATGSCSPNRNHAVIANGDGFDRPITTVAHELGHLATGHALDIDVSYPGTCNSAHSYTSDEDCEKVAWHEGIANFWAVVTQWSKNTSDSDAVFGTSGNTAGVIETACGTSDGWDTEACHTAALWDFFDDPTSDDDQIDDSQTNIAASTVANILDQYTNGTGNRENNESGSHGNNHWDFLENLDDLLDESVETDMRSIYIDVDFCTSSTEGGEEPYGTC